MNNDAIATCVTEGELCKGCHNSFYIVHFVVVTLKWDLSFSFLWALDAKL